MLSKEGVEGGGSLGFEESFMPTFTREA